MFDLAIIGGGPAGSAAAVYAARKLLKTVLITEEFGGQSIVSPDIQNWIGTPHLSGEELAKNLEAHVREYAGTQVAIETGDRVDALTCEQGGFTVTTRGGKHYSAKAVLVVSGGSRKRLDAKNADQFEHKGLTYCASCDGPLFAGQDVAVVGGGNAGFETASQLLAYAKSVTLLQRSGAFTADPTTVEKVLAHPHMRGITNATPTEVTGDKFVSGLTFKDQKTGAEQTLPVSGIFVEIGMIPNTQFVESLVDVDQYKRIIVDPRTQRTSLSGIWAAGDCTNGLYHQNNIAAGDAVKALEDIYLALRAH